MIELVSVCTVQRLIKTADHKLMMRGEWSPWGESWDMADPAAWEGFKAQCRFLLSSCWSSVWTSSYTLW